MRIGIFLASAALTLAVFAVPEAQGKSGSDVDQRVSGSSFIIDVDSAGNTTTLENLIAKGQPGTSDVNARTLLGPFGPDVDDLCPEGFPFVAELISFDFVATYKDGSLLRGSADEGQVVCTDGNPEGPTNIAEVAGSYTAGTGRFEGASGRWRGESVAKDNLFTGTVTGNLD